MRTAREPNATLERLARAASRMPVPEDDDPALGRVALATGRARARTRSRRRALAWSSACVALVAVGWAVSSRTVVSRPVAASDRRAPSTTEPTHSIALGRLDRAHVAAGASMTVESVDQHAVRLRLDDGSALFDVQPGHARRFEVATPVGTVVVRGTVFAVGVRPPRDLSVRVYEGRVDVESVDGVRGILANDALHRGAGVEIPVDLERRAQEAASARLHVTRASGGIDVSPTSAPRDDPEAASTARRDGSQAPSSASRSLESPRDVGRTAARVTPTRSTRSARAAGRAPSLETLRAMCARGEHEAVVATMTSLPTPTTMRDEWYLVLGDAYRGLRQTRQAASAYRTAAGHATPSRSAVAGLLAAQQLAELGDPLGALAMLHETHATTLGAPVDESASALELELLVRLQRMDEVKRAARRYLSAFPGGSRTSRAIALAE